jgi:hypothetical protein
MIKLRHLLEGENSLESLVTKLVSTSSDLASLEISDNDNAVIRVKSILKQLQNKDIPAFYERVRELEYARRKSNLNKYINPKNKQHNG